MMLNQFIQDIGSELQELFWEAPQKTYLEQSKHLEKEIESCLSGLNRRRAAIRDLRDRLQQGEERTGWLAQRVKVYLHIQDQVNAWRHALELDRLRRALEIYRSELERHQQAYLTQTSQLRHLKQQLAELDDRLYSRERGNIT